MKYISAGCWSYSDRCTYGAGVGWIKTDLFETNTNKHGLGVHFGAVGTERRSFKRHVVNGVGLSYHYFFNGIEESGLNVGLTLLYGKTDHNSGTTTMLEFGYQF